MLCGWRPRLCWLWSRCIWILERRDWRGRAGFIQRRGRRKRLGTPRLRRLRSHRRRARLYRRHRHLRRRPMRVRRERIVLGLMVRGRRLDGLDRLHARRAWPFPRRGRCIVLEFLWRRGLELIFPIEKAGMARPLVCGRCRPGDPDLQLERRGRGRSRSGRGRRHSHRPPIGAGCREVARG